MNLLRQIELQLMMFDRRIEFTPQRGIPFGSSYFCRGVLTQQLIIEHLEPDGVCSGMYGDAALSDFLNK